MKIWYQTQTAYRFDPLWDDYGKTLYEQCKRAARADTEIYVTGRPIFPHDPPISHYKFMMYYHRNQMLNHMRKAEREGYDAFIIGCSEDPGLVEGRGMLNIPVAAIAQSNMYVAAMLGELFAVVTSPSVFVEMYRQLVRQYGLTSKYLYGHYCLDVSEEEMAQSIKNPKPLADKFRELARRAVADGASVIVPIPPFIANLLYRSGGVNSIDGATVLDPVAVVVKVAEMMVDLKKLGMDVSRIFQVYANPGKEAVDKILQDYTKVFKIEMQG